MQRTKKVHALGASRVLEIDSVPPSSDLHWQRPTDDFSSTRHWEPPQNNSVKTLEVAFDWWTNEVLGPSIERDRCGTL